MMRDRVHAIHDEALANDAYIVEVGNGELLVVDPRRDIEEYLALATELSGRIVAMLETHLHADFVSGVQELMAATGATLYAPEAAHIAFEHTPVSADQVLNFGDVTVRVIATPGHTPEHVAYLLTSSDGDVVFSGGSLIAGGAARTDLSGSERTEELARAQFASLRRVADLGDDTLLCPTHGSGSFCSAVSSSSGMRTIKEERLENQLLLIKQEDKFVEELLNGFGSYPSYFAHLGDVNQQGVALLKDLHQVVQLDGAGAKEAIDRGAWLIDTRMVAAWTKAHPPGAVSIELRPPFASWLGWVVPFGEEVVLLLEPEQLDEALRLSRRIGYDRIAGWFTLDDWRAAGLPLENAKSVSVEEADGQSGAVLLDVRQNKEYASEHVPGAVHMELAELIAGNLPDAQDLIVYCGTGKRSATAVSLLARAGVRATNLEGGISAWREAKRPLT